MSEAAKQLYWLSDHQLGKLVGQGTYNPGAQAAWDRARIIRETGGSPKVFYSEFNGFNVYDEDDHDSLQKVISMENRSKPFPG